MRITTIGLVASALMVLAGCAPASQPVEAGPTVETSTSADAELCQNVDPAMKAFMTRTLAAEDATAEWKALNPILMEVETDALENSDLLQVAAQLVAFTILSPTDVGEKLIGTTTVDLLAACDAAGSPMVQSQKVLDSLTQ